MTESEEELKSLLMKVKEDSKKVYADHAHPCRQHGLDARQDSRQRQPWLSPA